MSMVEEFERTRNTRDVKTKQGMVNKLGDLVGHLDKLGDRGYYHPLREELTEIRNSLCSQWGLGSASPRGDFPHTMLCGDCRFSRWYGTEHCCLVNDMIIHCGRPDQKRGCYTIKMPSTKLYSCDSFKEKRSHVKEEVVFDE